ncbi:MAG TPA: hypothetical protein VHQ00_03700 [Chloroflexota bacterium]|jgi:hypothetical protein|nr:hypothetical protein [Chloroflexota bacterium]
MAKPPASQPAEAATTEAEGTTVLLTDVKAVLDRIRTATPGEAALLRAVWEDLLREAKARAGGGEDEGIDYSDLPSLGDDDAYWTGGRIGPVLPAGATGRPD